MRKRLKTVAVSITVTILFLSLIVHPLATMLIYDSIFACRYETAPWQRYDVSDFDGLSVLRSDFRSGEHRLAGYKYFRADTTPHATLVLSHGLGGGGHNSYMNVVDFFTRVGYFVFTYDATANDESEGDRVGGLPQGPIDLCAALDHVATLDECRDLPTVLLGHSWGGYSVLSALRLHSEVKAAVSVSGFAHSHGILRERSASYVGASAELLLPAVYEYERMKYGDFSSCGAIDGIEASNAKIMIIHSSDDTTVPMSLGYSLYYERYADNPRFEFILRDGAGHSYPLSSPEATAARTATDAAYADYLAAIGAASTEELKAAFMADHLDRSTALALDQNLMSRILAFCESSLAK